MHVGRLIAPGLAVAFAAAAPADAQGTRGPDAHIVRPVRGDVLVVDRPQAGPAATPYVAPYRGWRYSAVKRGDRLRAGFYGARYVVTDPAPYGLVPASANRRWIRYGDDLLLVDRATGRVLRVVPGGYTKVRH